MMKAAFVRNRQIGVASIEDPEPAANEAILRVFASSVNQGEVRAIGSAPHWTLKQTADAGWVPGWDFSGVVEAPAADGSGPCAGTRVAGWVRQGAWAQKAVAPVDQLVVLPDAVPFDVAAAIPIAGLTAWHTLRVGGLAAGKSVLVTGAAGGVGRYALQLIREAGGSATAMVGSEARARSVRHLADTIVIGLPDAGQYDIVLDCIGGASLAACFGLLAPYGAVVSYGNATGEVTCFEAGPAFRKPCLTLHSFALYDELGRRGSNSEGLADLLDMFANGRLQVDIALHMKLDQVQEACEALMTRTVDGKISLEIC